MAKHIRSIKADLCDDETLGECSRDARYLFVGLITRVDDHGRFRANPALLRSRIYPYDQDVTNADVARWVAELVKKGRIETYLVDGQQYLVLTRWGKHQRIDNAAKSELPPPPEPTLPQAAANDGEPPLEGKGREEEGKGMEGKVELTLASASPTSCDPVLVVFKAWQEHTGHPKAVLDKKRRGLIVGALKNYPLADLVDACRGVLLSPHHRGENDRHTVYDDLDVVLRDAKHIEEFRGLARGEGRAPPRMPNGTDMTQRNLARMEAQNGTS